MTANKAILTMVAFMTYMIMSGLLTQIGVIIEPISKYLNISITDAAAMFSYLTGGTLLGTFIALAAFSQYRADIVLKTTYTGFLIVAAALLFADIRNPVFVSIVFVLLGAACGVGLSGGAVLISKLYEENHRASAFIVTDCAFSAAGFLFPTLATIIIAAGLSWTLGYGAVSILVAIVLASTFLVRYPATETQTAESSTQETPPAHQNIWIPRVFIMGVALCMYLMAQTTFLTWAPNYLQTKFGMEASVAGSAVGNYWGPSIFGLVIAAVLVTRVPPRLVLLCASVIAVLISSFLMSTNDPETFLTVTLSLGFLTSCIFKIGISVGSLQIKNAPARLVTFLICASTLGSTIAPALSSRFVKYFGVDSAMIMTMVSFSTMLILFIVVLTLEKIDKSKSTAAASI
ncbi:MAG: MFS transporter TsgA [Pseudomonadota bacterium]